MPVCTCGSEHACVCMGELLVSCPAPTLPHVSLLLCNRGGVLCNSSDACGKVGAGHETSEL